jgi:hypothetical protein
MSDRSIAETSISQHTPLTRGRHLCPEGIQNHNPRKHATADCAATGLSSIQYWGQQNAHKSIKNSYIHSDLLNVSANLVAILREVKHKNTYIYV